MLTQVEFIIKCNKKLCPSYKDVTKNCLKIYKQDKCYVKYAKQQEKKFKVDEEYLKFVRTVWEQDVGFYDYCHIKGPWKKYCKLWNILTEEERLYTLDINPNDIYLNENLDVAHILPKSSHKDKKYDPLNAVLIGRMFHSLLDNFKHPVTRLSITREEKTEWLQRAKDTRLKGLEDV